MDELGDEAKALLAGYRDAHDVPGQAQERVLTRLEQRLARGDLPLPGVDAELRWLKPSAVLRPWYQAAGIKLSAATLVVAGLVGLQVWSRRAHGPESARTAAPVTAIAAAPQPMVEPLVVAREPAEAPGAAPAGEQPSVRGRRVQGAQRTREVSPQRDLARAGGGAVERDPAQVEAAEASAPVIDAPPERALKVAAVAPSAGEQGAAQTVEQGKPATVAPATPPSSSLGAELSLLQQAHQALERQRPDLALATLADHARRFPRGELSELREVTRLLALCAAGRRAEAQQGAQTFMSQRPRSPYLQRVRKLCE